VALQFRYVQNEVTCALLGGRHDRMRVIRGHGSDSNRGRCKAFQMSDGD